MKVTGGKYGRFILGLLAIALNQAAYAADEAPSLDEVVVTAPRSDAPLLIQTDPKAPRQPVPAHDGADYLKTIPGFSVIRKGGSGGEPVLRGMAGSRLGIMVDGQNVLGGCNGRMDAPTAYIFPEMFDRLSVVKGPSVRYGPGNSAGTVLFERKPKKFSEAGYRFYTGLLAGSFGRHDEVLDGSFGNAAAYGQVIATNSQANDYRDGSGNAVHSAYRRHSATAAVGWTPDEHTRMELAAVSSDGRAAYADRSMDGTKFLRQGVGLQFERSQLTPLIEKIEARASSNGVDHVMDDQTLRTPGMMGYANLKRKTSDARLAATLHIAGPALLTLGLDAQSNAHSSRSAPPSGIYTPFADDASFKQSGVFGELDYQSNVGQRVLAGYRADFWQAQDKRGAMIMNWNSMTMAANPSSGQQRNAALHSGFTRIEQRSGEFTTVFAGLGHTERFPDYWELIAKQSVASASAFNTRPEKTNQLDAGMLYQSGGTDFNISLFYSKITDFILVDYRSKMGTGAVRNVNATSYGTEAGYAQALGGDWKINSSLSYVHGSNDTDGLALAQLPPLEGRLGLAYDDRKWSFGALLRMVAAQERYAANMGNIAGKDLGRAAGFSVFSLNADWRANKGALVTAGVDNVFNRTYAEAISRAGNNGMGGAIPGYVRTTRVNEAGRTIWLKASLALD